MLIAMAVYDTEDNRRTGLTEQCIESLGRTVNFTRHRLFVCDNASCDETLYLYKVLKMKIPFIVIHNSENIGTAAAINKAWALRKPGEHCVKMDNDVVVHEQDWPDLIEDVFRRDPTVGICGLKRKDIWESPEDPHPRGDFYKSKLEMLPHEPGERWLVIEEVNHVMGTCQGYSSALLDKIGFLYQMQDVGNIYGFDDSLAAYRSQIAGFRNVFLPHPAIDHIDPGGDYYTEWKKQQAGEWMQAYQKVRDEYLSGERDVYYRGS